MARCLRRRARLVSNSPSRSGLLAQRVSCGAVVCLSVLLTGCADPGSDAVVLTADLPLHLEDHLDVATIEGSEIPTDVPEPVEWRFDEPQPGWKLAEPWTPTVPTIDAASLAYTDDALRITLTEGTRDGDGDPNGGLELELPDWHREDWAYLVVRARTSDPVFQMRVGFNRREGSKRVPRFRMRLQATGPLSSQTVRSRPTWCGPTFPVVSGRGRGGNSAFGFTPRTCPASISSRSLWSPRKLITLRRQRAHVRRSAGASTAVRCTRTHLDGSPTRSWCQRPAGSTSGWACCETMSL